MKKHYIIISIITGFAIFLFGVSIKNVTEKPQITTHTKTDEAVYILSDYNGRIALFESDKQTPIKVFDIFTQSLPQNDAKNIKNGIKLKKSDIEKTIEDYIS